MSTYTAEEVLEIIKTELNQSMLSDLEDRTVQFQAFFKDLVRDFAFFASLDLAKVKYELKSVGTFNSRNEVIQWVNSNLEAVVNDKKGKNIGQFLGTIPEEQKGKPLERTYGNLMAERILGFALREVTTAFNTSSLLEQFANHIMNAEDLEGAREIEGRKVRKSLGKVERESVVRQFGLIHALDPDKDNNIRI